MLKTTERRLLLAKIDEYEEVNANYDEAFLEVGRRLRSKQWATKSDLGALVFWKRIRVGRWASDLQKVPEVEIKRKTAEAFEPGLKDSERLDALDLPGCGPAELSRQRSSLPGSR